MNGYIKGIIFLVCCAQGCFGEQVDVNILGQARENHRIRAFLDVIAYAEGTYDAGILGYSLRYPYRWFRGFEAHPGVMEFVKKSGEVARSSAAGRYMFLSSTWAGLQKQYKFSDFSPVNQDLAAIALLYERDAAGDIILGRFAQAIGKVNKIWAPLPGAPYGQTNTTMPDLQKFFNERVRFFSNGGVA